MGDAEEVEQEEKRVNKTRSGEELAPLEDRILNLAHEAFDEFNKTGQGLKVIELGSCLKKMGQNPPLEFIERHDEEIDPDGTGFLSFEDFEFMVQLKLKDDADLAEIEFLFRIIDKDKKGEVHCDEFRWILEALMDDATPEEIDEMLAEVDADGSGLIDMDEFRALMMGDEPKDDDDDEEEE